MALISKTYTFSAGAVIVAAEHNTNFDQLFNLVNGALDNTNLASNAAIFDTQLGQITTAGKVSGAALTSLSSIPSGAGIIPSANLPGTSNYRSQMYVMQASTTTITVAPGSLDVGGTVINKTANTTLTISTAGDWAGGASLRATSTTAYVGVDISGNIKMHTTAPTHADYAVSISAANNTKRYATWSSTVYRIIGWFYMNATGSGELDAFGVSNLADGSVKNRVNLQTASSSTGTTTIPFDDTIPQNTEGDQYMSQVFVPTNANNRLDIRVLINVASSGNDQQLIAALFQDATANALIANTSSTVTLSANKAAFIALNFTMKAAATILTTFKVRAGSDTGGTVTFNGNGGSRKFGGVYFSYILIEEVEAQLT